MLTDDDLEYVERVKAGDRQSFAKLVNRHQDRVHNYLMRFVGNREDAADLTQESFLRAYRSLDSYCSNTPFGVWLFSIAHNLACDLLRRRKLVEFVDINLCIEPMDPVSDPEWCCSLSEQLVFVERALATLKAEQREILVLRDQEGMSHEDISSIMGINVGTVKSRLSRSREALHRTYKKMTKNTNNVKVGCTEFGLKNNMSSRESENG
ncbi:MAG: RNA polymerase sigma factor [Thiohalophilus sp.]